jgi:hypothetical protein
LRINPKAKLILTLKTKCSTQIKKELFGFKPCEDNVERLKKKKQIHSASGTCCPSKVNIQSKK